MLFFNKLSTELLRLLRYLDLMRKKTFCYGKVFKVSLITQIKIIIN